MRNFTKGYIGKSLTMGFLGILGTLVACGGAGITGAGASTPSDHVLFTMGLNALAYNNSDPDLKYSTQQGGKVWIGSSGGWSYANFGIFEQSSNNWAGGAGAIDFFGGGGVLFSHAAALTSGSQIYYRITPRASGAVDVSGTDNLLISLGNDKIGLANTHNQVTVFLEGGTLSGTSYSNSCKTSIDLRTADTNKNITTYTVPLSSFSTCDSGTLTSLKTAVNQVVIKVLTGNGNATSDAASGGTTETLIKLGQIAFSKAP